MSRRWTALLVFLALVLLVFAGPRASTDLTWTEPSLGEPLDEWLAASEAQLGNVTPGKEKGIVWSDSSKARTDLAVVYLHGFSASRLEAAPYPDSIAAELGANLYYSRLAGHGRDGDDLGASTAEEWYQSAAEAIRIGEAIGDSLIVIGLSTGATLAAAAALDPDLRRKWKAQIWISPNFTVANPESEMLLWPWGSVLLRMVQGDTYSWEPQNERHAMIGSQTYPSRVLLEVVSLTDVVRNLPFEDMVTPTLMFYSPDDRVISAPVAQDLFAQMTAPKDSIRVLRALDENMHVIVGDALGPENSTPFARRTVEWIRSLGDS